VFEMGERSAQTPPTARRDDATRRHRFRDATGSGANTGFEDVVVEEFLAQE